MPEDNARSRPSLVGVDYSACIHCKFLEETSANGEINYCLKEYKPGTDPKSLPERVFMMGCDQFEWNGMPINEFAYRDIMNQPEYESSSIRKLSGKNITTQLTFWDLDPDFSRGSYFKRKEFKKSQRRKH